MINLRISSLSADYVGPFEHLTLGFKPKVNADEAEVHILTGENGTGKSTILLFLTSFINYTQLAPRINKKYSTQFKVKTTFQGLESSNKEGVTWLGEQPIEVNLSNKRIEVNGVQASVVGHYVNNIQGNKNIFGIYPFNFAFFAYSGYRRVDDVQLQGIQEFTDNPFENALNFNNSVRPQALLQWIANNKTKEALALARNDQQSAKRYNNSIVKIEQAVSDITGNKIEFALNENPLSVVISVDGKALDFGLLPDGLKSIISWIADLLMRMDRVQWEENVDVFDRNFILFLDEIEVHLHPKWQRRILPVIKKLFRNAQIFISTHSPFVIGSVDGAWVYKLKVVDGYSVLDGNPMLSEDANSYRTILEEVFNVQEQFGPGVTKQLDRFYELKDMILTDKITSDNSEFKELVANLAPQSKEMENIIGMELKQIGRLKGVQIDNYL